MSVYLCPLCKRSTSGGGHLSQPPSRLCSECRALIATLMPQPASRSLQFSAVPTAEIAPSNLPFAEAFAPLYSSPPPDAEENARLQPVFKATGGVAEARGYHNFAAETALPEAERESPPKVADPPVIQDTPASARQAEPERDGHTDSENEAAAREVDEISLAPHNINSKRSAWHESPPVDDIPPSWDSTMDQYPLLLTPPREEPMKPALSKAIMGIVVIVALAAGFFLFRALFQPSSGNQQAQSQTLKNEASVQPAPASNPAPVETPPDRKVNAAAPAPQAKAAEKTPPAAAPAAGEGKVSLQAAVLSFEAPANEYVARLKKADIPAYVSPSGNKFKILIGPFSNTTEAQRFIATAKERAKAAGVKLENLIVSK